MQSQGTERSPATADQLPRLITELARARVVIVSGLRLIVTPELSSRATSSNPDQQKLLTLLQAGVSDSAELLAKSNLDARTFGQSLTMLEIEGFIQNAGNNAWRVV